MAESGLQSSRKEREITGSLFYAMSRSCLPAREKWTPTRGHHQDLEPSHPTRRSDFFDSYRGWLATSNVEEEGHVQEGHSLLEECINIAIDETEEEIQHLERYRNESLAVENSRKQADGLRFGIPDAEGLNRIMRYEVSREWAVPVDVAKEWVRSYAQAWPPGTQWHAEMRVVEERHRTRASTLPKDSSSCW